MLKPGGYYSDWGSPEIDAGQHQFFRASSFRLILCSRVLNQLRFLDPSRLEG